MFKDDYSHEMDKIVPSNDTKNSIREMLKNGEKAKKPKNPAVPWRIGFALTAAAAIVLTVAFGHIIESPEILKSKGKNNALSYSDSYGDIYKKLNKLRKEINKDDAAGGVIYEEYVIEDDADTGTNTTATGGLSAKSEPSDSIRDYQEYSDQVQAQADETFSTNTEDYSDTTTQVEGVDEADIVKTDGKYIYSLIDNTVKIVEANSGNPRLISTIALPNDGDRSYHEMYLSGGRLTVVGSVYGNYGSSITRGGISTMDMIITESETEVLFYDVSSPASAELLGVRGQSGNYNSSRMIDGVLYVISNHSVNLSSMEKGKPETYVPSVSDGDNYSAVEAKCVLSPTDELETAAYLVACSYDSYDASFVSAVSVLGSADTVYSSTNNIITATPKWDSGDDRGAYTSVNRFSIKDGEITYECSGSVPGTLINQFAIDEHNGYFRFVTTEERYELVEGKTDSKVSHKVIVGESTTSYDPTAESTTSSSASTSSRSTFVKYLSVTVNGLYVLDRDLNTVGFVDGLAQDERVYSVRFMGNTAYFVTFKQIDPLFSVDLSDPKNPKVIGELKIPGFSEYLYPYGDGLLLGIGQHVEEGDNFASCVKLSMFDISDPANVTEKDKTNLTFASYSEALDNHKACIVHSGKNLIGFSVTGNSDSPKGDTYVVYSYNEDGFKQLAKIQCDDFMSKRGLFIGEVFYIVGQKSVRAFSINDFSPIGTLNF